MHTINITTEFRDYPSVQRLAQEAFPPEEYMAPSKLIEMAERGEVEFLGLYDEDTFAGFMVVSIFEKICYLFFLAIDPVLRSRGYGSRTLKLLEERYPDKQQVVDFEMIDDAAPNHAQRVTRKAFYMRNGYKETGKYISYLGVDYEILCKSDEFDFVAFQRMMCHFHIDNFHPQYFEKV